MNVAYLAHITQLDACMLQNESILYGKIILKVFFPSFFEELVPRPILSSSRNVRHYMC